MERKLLRSPLWFSELKLSYDTFRRLERGVEPPPKGGSSLAKATSERPLALS
jgi:hypothetical protein